MSDELMVTVTVLKLPDTATDAEIQAAADAAKKGGPAA
jgi:hypothetical protein